MEFNNTTTKLGICQEVDDTCGSNLISYPIESKTRRANMALSDFTGIALSSDDRWQWDDTNYTDLPIGFTNLVSGQRDYSFESAFLKILKVEIKDENGKWIELDPIDRNDSDVSLEELYSTSATPKYYDKFANSILLYPATNYDSTGGLKVSYQRDCSYFTSTDTTKQPGIPSIFHKYIALKISEPYCRDKKLDNYVSIRNEIQLYEETKIPEFYSKRNKDERPTITGKFVDYK